MHAVGDGPRSARLVPDLDVRGDEAPAEPTALESGRDAQWLETGFDPILVFYPSGACETHVVDVEPRPGLTVLPTLDGVRLADLAAG